VIFFPLALRRHEMPSRRVALDAGSWPFERDLMIIVKNRQRTYKVNPKELQDIIEVMVAALGYPDFDVYVLLTTDKAIQAYNRDFRNKDKPTDILSFPFHAEHQPGKKIKVECDDDKNLGDIIISLAYVDRTAINWNRSFHDHLVALLAHGLAHLLNYDHQTDPEYRVMRRIENKLLRAAGYLS
jgi:probable rRNA maturation factor